MSHEGETEEDPSSNLANASCSQVSAETKPVRRNSIMKLVRSFSHHNIRPPTQSPHDTAVPYPNRANGAPLQRKFSLGSAVRRLIHRVSPKKRHDLEEKLAGSPTTQTRVPRVSSLGDSIHSPPLSPGSPIYEEQEEEDKADSLQESHQVVPERKPEFIGKRDNKSLALKTRPSSLTMVKKFPSSIDVSIPKVSSNRHSLIIDTRAPPRYDRRSKEDTGALPTPATLISCLCALKEEETLWQGQLTITDQDLTFSSTSHPSQLHFKVNYPDIVVIVPQSYQRISNGMMLATQLRRIRLVNIINRDQVLQLLTDEWLRHCRRMLLTPDRWLYDVPTLHCRVATHLNPELIDKGPTDKLSNNTLLLTTPLFDPTSPPPLLDAICRCPQHYRHVIIDTELPSAPLAIATTLFGNFYDSSEALSFSGIFLAARGAVVIKRTRWNVELDGCRTRILLVNLPDVLQPSKMMRVHLRQRLLRESADIVIVEMTLRHLVASISSQYQLRMRWCFSRMGMPHLSTHLLLSQELVKTVSSKAMPLEVVEAHLLEYSKRTIGPMIDALRVRLTVDPKAPKKSMEEGEEEGREEGHFISKDQSKLVLFKMLLFQCLLFFLIPNIRRALPTLKNNIFNRTQLIPLAFLLVLLAIALLYRPSIPPKYQLSVQSEDLEDFYNTFHERLHHDLGDIRHLVKAFRTRLENRSEFRK